MTSVSEVARRGAACACIAVGLLLTLPCPAKNEQTRKPSEASPPTAEPSSPAKRRAAARELGQRAIELMKQAEWTRAERLLREASKMYDAPSLAVLHGDALLELDELERAEARFEDAARTELSPDAPVAYRRAARIARARLKSIEATMPRLVVEVDEESTPPDRVWVDDVPLSPELLGIARRLNPGSYVVRAQWSDRVDQRRVDLKRGDRKRVALQWNDARPAAGLDRRAEQRSESRTGTASRAVRRQTIAGWSSIGVGGAGLTTGIAAGLMTQDREDTLEAQCRVAACPPSAASDIRALERSRVVSWVGYGVGVTGLATGGILLLTAGKEESETQQPGVKPYVGFKTVGVQGTF